MENKARWRALWFLVCAGVMCGWGQVPRVKPEGTKVATVPSRASGLEKAAEEFQLLTRELGLRSDSKVVQRSSGPVWNSWHGRLFENFRNDVLDATPHEVVQRGGARNMLRRNQFGFNVGGPLVIPKLYDGSRKTFFNISYEGVRERIGRSFLRTVALGAEQRGDFSQTVDLAGGLLPIYDPKSTQSNPNFKDSLGVSRQNLQYTRSPFPGNVIPVPRLDPVAQKALVFYPKPNASAGPFFRNNYFVFSPETNQANGMIFKLDHSVTDRHRVTFNGSFTNGLAGAPRLFRSIADPGGNDSKYSARKGTVDWTFTRNASTVHILTLDAHSDLGSGGRDGEADALKQIGLSGPVRGAFPIFRFDPYLGMGRSNPVRSSSHNYYYLTDALSTRWGAHRLRMYGQIRQYQVKSYLPNYPAGSFQFGSSLTSLPGINNTGHEFASFLLGLSESATASVVEHPSYWRGNFGRLGISDNYEYSKNLSFSGGISLGIARPRYEKYDRFSTVDLEQINEENGHAGAMVFANRNGRGRALQSGIVRPDASLGLAWNPGGSAKGVLRMSYGLSFGTVPIYTTQWATQGFAGQPTFVSPNIQLEPAVVLREGVPALAQHLPDLRPEAANFTVADLVEPTGKVPLYQSAGLSFERELPYQTVVALSLGHSQGQRLFVSNGAANPNAIPLTFLDEREALNSESYRRSIRPYPQYQRFNVYNSWPSGNYKRNAAALRLEKRSSSGLSLNATYELSKQMDDYSGPYGVQDFHNRQNEWSLTSSNNPQRLSMSASYELPFGAKKPLLAYQDWRRYLVDGWTLSSISSVQSGVPLALRPQFNNTGGVIDALRVNLVAGIDPALADPGPQLWFNPAAFAQPADFSAGNGPRTHPQLLGPGSQSHDLSISKRVAVSTERVLELTATGFNFTNTGNWADPDMVIGPAISPNANAGRIAESRGGRVIQVGLRLSF